MVKILNAALVALLVLSGFRPQIHAQSVGPTVIACAGGFSTSVGASLSATAGEAVVFTGSSVSVILTQGFQQPDETVVGVEGEYNTAGKTVVFPNPNNGTFTLITSNNMKREATIKVYSILGQQVLSTAVTGTVAAETTSYQLQLPQLPDGIYWLELLQDGGNADLRHILSVFH